MQGQALSAKSCTELFAGSGSLSTTLQVHSTAVFRSHKNIVEQGWVKIVFSAFFLFNVWKCFYLEVSFINTLL